MTLTPEKKNAEMAAERSVLARLFTASLDDFATLESTILDYTRKHIETSASDVLLHFKDANQRTVLHFACRGSVLQPILEASWLDAPSKAAILRTKDKDGMTPLMLAAQVSDPVVAERNVLLLLEHAGDGPKLGLARSHAGATALHYASGARATSRCVDALYLAAPIALQTPSRQGGMPLHWACAVPPPADASETIAALLECGADVNASPNPVPPPVHVALAAGQERHAQQILGHARDRAVSLQPSIDYELPGGINVFHMAADLNMVSFLAELLEYASANGVNDDAICRRNEEGLTPLETAAKEGHVGCVLLLLPLPDRSEESAIAFIDDFRAHRMAAASVNEAKPRLPPKPEGNNKASEPDVVEQQAQQEAAALLSQNHSVEEDARQRAEQHKKEGNDHFAKKEYQQACDAYSHAIATNPCDAAYYSNRSACFLQLNQLDAALKDATVSRMLRPDWPKAAYRVAVARLALGRYEDAAVAAWEGLAQDPTNDELKSLLKKCVKKGRQVHLQSKTAGSR
jgi:ankyrin repeat protein